MTWEELRVLLNSFKKGEANLDERVTFTSTEAMEYLDLVQSWTNDSLTFIAAWNNVEDNDDQTSA